MKGINRFIIILFFLALSSNSTAQTGPPPPPGGGGDGDNHWGNSLNGSSPIGNELVIFLVLGAAYGGKKFYDISKNDNIKATN